MNVLITGGAGFIGRHLTKELLKSGCEVIVYDSLSPQIHGEDAKYQYVGKEAFVLGDVCDGHLLAKYIENVNVVYHLAAETGTGQSMYQIRQYVNVNEIGTATLLEAIAKSQKKDIQLVLASSRSIYGEGAYRSSSGTIVQPQPRSYEQLSEGVWEIKDRLGVSLEPIATSSNLPAKPGSIYAATKYSQEMLFKVFSEAQAIPCTILRFQNVYGEGQSLRNPYTGIISIFYNRMRQGLPINIFEDGLESRDFVHVSDVVDALISSVKHSVYGPPIVANIGSGDQTKVIDLAYLLSDVSELSIPIEVTGDFRVGDIRHCFADLECARRTIGFSPKVSLRAGLASFVSWAKDQPEYQDDSDLAMNELAKHGLTK